MRRMMEASILLAKDSTRAQTEWERFHWYPLKLASGRGVLCSCALVFTTTFEVEKLR